MTTSSTLHIALLGAGFSRNWHGWLGQEVLGELLGRVVSDTDTYHLLRKTQNFEETLAIVRENARRLGTPASRKSLELMESAILETFGEMNKYFASLHGLDFPTDQSRSVQRFLGRFDAIYTLNQDLLLELHYTGIKAETAYYFPGVDHPADWGVNKSANLQRPWYPADDFVVRAGNQPIFKLHGSVNWRDGAGGPLIIMGGGKGHAIAKNPLLAKYMEQFRHDLSTGSTKVMTIGYGFRDTHINDLLVEASDLHGMQMYLVDPRGLTAFDADPRALIPPKNPLADIRLIGLCTRRFMSAFSSDDLQRQSLEGFFK